MMKFFDTTHRAEYLSRPNRYTVWCRLGGKKVKAYLPNPGRLWELLLPGSELLLEKAAGTERATAYTAVAVFRQGAPVMLHTHRTNDVAGRLIEAGRVPGLEGAKIVRREVTRGRSRFDFLLEKRGKEIVLEVKSCTLFSGRVAMFPDAVTARGKRHVEELAELGGVVLFVVHSPRAEVFLPEYHTDLAFARTLYQVRRKVKIIPLGVRWNEDLTLSGAVRTLHIPWPVVKREALDRGAYLVLMNLKRDRTVKVGKLGKIRFRKGHYIYVGSAMANLSKRIERHRRLRKKMHWHLDYLRPHVEFVAGLPVLSSDDLECAMAGDLKKLAEEVADFGASDCRCRSHLFRMEGSPFDSDGFQSLLMHYRMERLVNGRA
jgi:sugar fermentation stimulation protein A